MSNVVEVTGADPGFCVRGVQNFAAKFGFLINIIIHKYVTALPLLASR